MWTYSAFDNLVNLDHCKLIYICKASEIEFTKKIELKEFVVCALDAANNFPVVFQSYDTKKEAEEYITNLFYDLKGLA